ncbi:sugar phosphate isomerase/epimerase family protein [Novosphingobium aquimarinum]|uniref:sugar phosphate isomerase/epimerase family protein n=1 Tax=Novosphingobium aquimarinum TaxID=2682494 RepID=UPI0012EC6BEA|nr:sugar phosphate isomerase/epimerase family protein [Novosphingobium aquimarinum]
MSPHLFTLGISEFTTLPWTFDEDVERYARLGIDAIEVVEAKLDDGRYAEQMQSIAAAGLIISAVQPRVRTFFDSRMMPTPTALDERVACLRASIERLARFAPGAPFITNTGAHPKGDMAEAMTVVAEKLGELGTIAADHGVLLALEPLNPTSVNVESAIWTVDQGLEIIERSGSDTVGLCLDFWNVWQNAGIEGAIARAGNRIFTVQASDWRAPRSFADRIVPGAGVIPLDRLIAATRKAGYDKPWVVEIFSNDVADSLYETDLESVIQQSRAGMTAAWQASEALL